MEIKNTNPAIGVKEGPNGSDRKFDADGKYTADGAGNIKVNETDTKVDDKISNGTLNKDYYEPFYMNVIGNKRGEVLDYFNHKYGEGCHFVPGNEFEDVNDGIDMYVVDKHGNKLTSIDVKTIVGDYDKPRVTINLLKRINEKVVPGSNESKNHKNKMYAFMWLDTRISQSQIKNTGEIPYIFEARTFTCKKNDFDKKLDEIRNHESIQYYMNKFKEGTLQNSDFTDGELGYPGYISRIGTPVVMIPLYPGADPDSCISLFLQRDNRNKTQLRMYVPFKVFKSLGIMRKHDVYDYLTKFNK